MVYRPQKKVYLLLHGGGSLQAKVSASSHMNVGQTPEVGVPANLTVVPSRLKLVPPVLWMVDRPQKWVYLLA